MAIGVMTRLDDVERVIQETSRHRDQVLNRVAVQLPEWRVKVHKAKAIYDMLNQVHRCFPSVFSSCSFVLHFLFFLSQPAER